MEMSALLDQLQSDGSLHRIATNNSTQFGTTRRTYLGATILPERPVTSNQYRETRISYRTVIANNGSRYSPAQKKNGKLVGHFDVILADNDIADDFTGEDYDTLIQLITPVTGPVNQSLPAMDASDQVQRWVDAAISLPLVELNEKQRWEALVAKQVVITGDNGFTEPINYPSFPDLNLTAANWNDPTVDPWNDLNRIKLAFAARGVTIQRIIAGTQVVNILGANPNMRARLGLATINASGQIRGSIGIADLTSINAALARDSMPAIETYDLMYRTQIGADYFLPRDAMVFIGQTDSEERIDLGDGQYATIENTLGYEAIGRGVGRPNSGRYILVQSFVDKPPRITAQGWQTSLPVLTQPEAVATLRGITTP